MATPLGSHAFSAAESESPTPEDARVASPVPGWCDPGTAHPVRTGGTTGGKGSCRNKSLKTGKVGELPQFYAFAAVDCEEVTNLCLHLKCKFFHPVVSCKEGRMCLREMMMLLENGFTRYVNVYLCTKYHIIYL